ncbi:MAG: bifunctional folylpolyglutamate synthase/dihydrofolate synthase, partial [Cyclobacteriaceae bacterium]|nr:bifunctional folylpolyglutamate synthase/dihydrofolate synthase [Cyclobacteriaceae bacterium]
ITAKTDLAGEYQIKNIPGVMKVLDLMNLQGFHISDDHIHNGFSHVVKNTGLLGRWQKIHDNPLTICDTVHNELGIKCLIRQIEKIQYDNLYIIWGSVEGKDLRGVFKHLPKDAIYYFCEASVPRALKAELLQKKAMDFGCRGLVVRNVNVAIEVAREKAGQNDLVFIGGSNFIIAEINDLK